ncbi:mechanosensitive ion channel protein MscS [Tumebacillus avium]|uniref:Mechanosensitive ion channel protein MscS n=1 Tax=Tumebacillus avium TaxID=1903704 RepID=A0A1Y0INF3_9BACL|nr:mechanosensitive ion channel family protein [Tumebacillus avium]ARU60884.1 mechanosensitive ion channel protein MscS [Tumebacillus avium]
METIQKTLANLGATLASTEFWLGLGWIVFKIVLILVAAKLVMNLGRVMIERVLSHRTMRMDERRGKTIIALLLNVMRYVVYFLVVLMILSNIGINVTTLIAGAGVAGLAIGFGAQSLVKDVITGFFIIFEDQFGVGDNVMINTNLQIRGNVEEVGLRISKVRAYTGEIHIIPNSQIQQVTNFSKTNSLAVVDVSVAYEEDLQKVFAVMKEVGHAVQAENENVLGDPQVLGVQMIGPHNVVVRMTMDCKPMEHYGVGRELRQKIKEAFDREGIEIPYPKQVALFPGQSDMDEQKKAAAAGS